MLFDESRSNGFELKGMTQEEKRSRYNIATNRTKKTLR